MRRGARIYRVALDRRDTRVAALHLQGGSSDGPIINIRRRREEYGAEDIRYTILHDNEACLIDEWRQEQPVPRGNERFCLSCVLEHLLRKKSVNIEISCCLNLLHFDFR